MPRHLTPTECARVHEIMLVAPYGHRAATANALAEELGCHVGTVYRHAPKHTESDGAVELRVRNLVRRAEAAAHQADNAARKAHDALRELRELAVELDSRRRGA